MMTLFYWTGDLSREYEIYSVKPLNYRVIIYN